MEHTNNGSIKDYIKLHSSLKIFISEEYLWNLFIQCAKALRFLHSNGIVHQSISPRHLLMTNEKLIKLELCPQKEGLINLIDETLMNLRNWGDSTVILLSWESTSP